MLFSVQIYRQLQRSTKDEDASGGDEVGLGFFEGSDLGMLDGVCVTRWLHVREVKMERRFRRIARERHMG